MARAKGIYFWTPDGKRYIDFNSQLMCVNIGHGDERVIEAIQEQAGELAYADPFMATEPRAAGREARRDHAGRPRRVLLHHRRRRGQRERDQARAIGHRAPQDPGPLPLVPRRRLPGRSALTGDPRRWANEPGIPGVVRVLDPYHGIQREPEPVDERSNTSKRSSSTRAAHHRGVHHRDGDRHERHPRPAGRLPPGHPRALRPPRDPDDRRRGDGRLRPHRPMVRGRSLGRRARPDHDGQGPDQRLRPARRGGDAPQDRRLLQRQGLLRRPHLQQPSAGLRGGAGDDRGLRDEDMVGNARAWAR